MTAYSGVERHRLKYAATINDEALSDETDADYELQYVDIGSVDSFGEYPRYRNVSFRGRAQSGRGGAYVTATSSFLACEPTFRQSRRFRTHPITYRAAVTGQIDIRATS